jgi:hypothetical protein
LADARVYMLTHPKEFDVVRLLNTLNLNLLRQYRTVAYSTLYLLIYDNSGRFSGNLGCGLFPSSPVCLFIYFMCMLKQSIEY